MTFRVLVSVTNLSMSFCFFQKSCSVAFSYCRYAISVFVLFLAAAYVDRKAVPTLPITVCRLSAPRSGGATRLERFDLSTLGDPELLP